jgi:hypothetical protein
MKEAWASSIQLEPDYRRVKETEALRQQNALTIHRTGWYAAPIKSSSKIAMEDSL